MAAAAQAVTAAELRAESDRFKDEIHALVLRNTRLQREIMTLNTGRERAAVQGIHMAHELTTELNALDDELRHVRAQCQAMKRSLSAQRTGVDRLGEQISTETSMSSTRFRRMSSAILGANNGAAPGKLTPAPEMPSTPLAGGRTRGASVATTATKARRGSVMMRFKGVLGGKKANPAGDDDDNSDGNKSVDIDEMPSPAPSMSPSSVKSGDSGKSSGRPPLQHSNSSNNVLLYKASDDKKSVADAHKEHLNNFRRSSRSSRRVLDTSGSM